MSQTLPIFEFPNLRRAFFILTFILGLSLPAFSQVPTPIAVPNCVGGQTFVDEYTSNASLTNYSYGDAGWIASNAASLGYTTTGGVLVNNPPAGTTQANGAYLTVNNALFSSANTNYTVQADFEMDSTTTGLFPGLFGIVFRETATGQAYIFQWNGFSGGWQIEKQTMTGGFGYSYIGPTVATPAYTAGTWVHLSVVVLGNTFNCYVDFGAGPQLIISSSDPGTNLAPYASGGVGIRTDNIYQPNVVRVANYMASTCGAAATPTETPTPTITPIIAATATNTYTPTITSTPTLSATPTNSPTITNTPTITPTQGPDIFYVAQNMFNPGTGSGSVSIFINTPTLGDYKMKIYNSAGEFIDDLGLGTPTTGTSHSFMWNGTDTAGTPCASGVYIIYYRELLGVHVAKIVLLR